MALPSSGALSISQIRNEQVNVGGLPSTYSLRTLSSQLGKSSPDSISEFYGYSGIVNSGLVLNLDAGNASSYTGSGTTWTDLSGNGNNATLISSPSYSTSNGGYFTLDGSTQYFSAADSSSLSITSTISMEMVIYVTSANYNMLVTKQPSGTATSNFPGNYEFRTNPDNSVQLIYQQAGGPSVFGGTMSGASQIPLNTWCHLVITNDGVGTITAYKNSINFAMSNSIASGPGLMNQTNNVPLLIGKRLDGFFFNGRIAVVRLYNKALSQAEITQNYNAVKARFGI